MSFSNTSISTNYVIRRSRSRRINFCLPSGLDNVKLQTQPPLIPDNLKIVFAAGGTAGHISPAVAIADEIRTLSPHSQILFLGTQSGIESTAVSSARYDFAAIPAVQLASPIMSFRNLLFPQGLILSTLHCRSKLREFKPDVVVGTGGYVSFPVCAAAAVDNIKLVIQEQNSVPGLANWLLSYLAHTVFVAYNSSIDCFPKNKCLVSGNPVRSSLRQCMSKVAARLHFFPKSGKAASADAKVLLILGGSLGANTINIAVLNLYRQLLLENKNFFIIWQTGVDTFNEMESLVKEHPRLYLSPFLHLVDIAYAASDLIVSRAGAMTCSEILVTGKPAILIPSPIADEGHQFKNATLMADLAGTVVITEDELDSITLGSAIVEILGNSEKIAEMGYRALKAAKPHAAREIAQHILSLVNTGNTSTV
uniref:Undecaprenyldiphospho-muramoylpentapeptide beta-N-acetylglucosaminyltransferase n=1 Tax=Kalanchoe fedtschenkoi TaxID=63787 RepID=A0A7N0VF06_KALFE